MILDNYSYKDLQAIYERYFSLGGIAGEIDNKFALISLICLLTDNQKKKNPDITCYEVIEKITSKGRGGRLPEMYLQGLAIVCEDFRKGSNSYNMCGLKSGKEMVDRINDILDKWLPF